MSETSETPARRASEGGTTSETSRRELETLIDEISAQSFPASDPPAWGVAAARLEASKRSAEPEE